MRIRLVGSSLGKRYPHQFLMSLIVNDRLAFDAGAIGYVSPVSDQKKIKHVFLSHSHLDHIGSLPIFLDNVYESNPSCPTVYAAEYVRECLQSDFFNDRVWPNFLRLADEETPFFRFENLAAGQTVIVDGLAVTPIAVDHVVPNLGFLIDDGDSTVALVYDTGPTCAVWQAMNQRDNLKAVFVEASFPDSMQWLAERAMHLTPKLLTAELTKLDKEVPVVVVHIKAAYDEEVIAELRDLKLPNLQIGEPDNTYVF